MNDNIIMLKNLAEISYGLTNSNIKIVSDYIKLRDEYSSILKAEENILLNIEKKQRINNDIMIRARDKFYEELREINDIFIKKTKNKKKKYDKIYKNKLLKWEEKFNIFLKSIDINKEDFIYCDSNNYDGKPYKFIKKNNKFKNNKFKNKKFKNKKHDFYYLSTNDYNNLIIELKRIKIENRLKQNFMKYLNYQKIPKTMSIPEMLKVLYMPKISKNVKNLKIDELKEQKKMLANIKKKLLALVEKVCDINTYS